MDAVTDVIDQWVADRDLSRRKLAFLESVYSQTMESIGEACSFDIAGGFYCSEVEIPQGSFMSQVVASVLDDLKPLPEGSRYVELSEELVTYGHLDEEAAFAHLQ